MRELPSRPLAFSAGPSTSGPMTWGQLAIWTPLLAFGDATAGFNIPKMILLDRGVAGEHFLAGVRELVERHTSLRTWFIGGHQEIAGAGELSVQVWELPEGGDPTEWASDVEGLADRSFDLTAGWPVRFGALVGSDGQVVGAAFAISHVAADGWAADLVRGDLLALLDGTAGAPEPRWEPLDQLAFERSDAGRRAASAALAQCAKVLSDAPASLFDYVPREVEGPPVGHYRLDSEALATAASMLAARTGTSVSTVVLAIASVWLAGHCGHDRAVFELVSGNRYTPGMRALRAPTSQDALLAVDLRGADLETALRAVFAGALKSYGRAAYHPDALTALKSEVGFDRGLRFDLAANYNYVRRGTDPAPGAVRASTGELAEMRERGTVTRLDPLDWHDKKFMLTFHHLGDRHCALSLIADSRYLPPTVVEHFLRGIELVACTALERTLSLAEVTGLIGVPPVGRGPDWVRTRAGWTRPAAVRDLVLAAVPGSRVLIDPQSSADGVVELTARITLDGAESDVAAVHRMVVSALTGEPGAVAPDRYVLCDGLIDSSAPAEE